MKNKLYSDLVFGVTLFSILFFATFVVFDKFVDLTLKFPFYQERDYCDEERFSIGHILFNLIVVLIDRNLMLDIYLFPVIIILYKSNDDILQGISKLDNIIKVSKFQTIIGGTQNK